MTFWRAGGDSSARAYETHMAGWMAGVEEVGGKRGVRRPVVRATFNLPRGAASLRTTHRWRVLRLIVP